ncbi:MAG: DegT/DnrJ/EryC1/StrS family aminotransferase [Calditrichaeota bacterium]|nr:MAG: DegT/DnrJ/EryC1/StrS family aminotransferase [Calditrichota bacterium]
MKYKYPVYQPTFSEKEKEYVNECLDSTWISSKGKFISLFEEHFARFNGVKYSAAVTNGTVALHLALIALGIGEGDEVIVPTLTYIASVNAIAYTGATPVFVDSLSDTWQMNPIDIKKNITHKTKAILAVHLYGHPCEMDSIVKIAKENDLFLVEDCAEAIGTKYKGTLVGTFGDIGTYSFFGNKTITTGEGGMVITNDETLHSRMVHYKGQGLAKYREYWHDVIGYNYRMTNICAAIGLAQLEKIQSVLNKKRAIANWYKEYLTHIPVNFHEEIGEVYHSYWMCSILVNEPKLRDSLRQYLMDRKIETRPVFYPVHTMPMYASKYQKHGNAEDLGWRGINLPSYPDLGKADVKYICQQIENYFHEIR